MYIPIQGTETYDSWNNIYIPDTFLPPGIAILVTLLLLILVLFLLVKMMEERKKRKMMPILSSEFDSSRYDPKLPWIEQLEALAYDESVWEFPR